MTTSDKKKLGLILTAKDKAKAIKIYKTIKANVAAYNSHKIDYEKFDASQDRSWRSADSTPAINAAVNQLMAHGKLGKCKCHGFSPSDSLEQFYRYGSMGMKRGGKIWNR